MERRYYNQQLETMSRDDFLAYQWGLLKEQIEYTYARSGLCQRQFKAARITPDDINDWDDFRNRVPYTTKLDLVADQEVRPPYGTRLAVPEEEVFQMWLTSGTSGKGQEVHAVTREDFELFLNGTCTMYTWVGWQKGDRVMLPLPLGVTAAAPVHLSGMQRLGLTVFNLGMYDTRTKLEYMKRFRLTGFFATVAYLETLTSEAEQMGIDPAKDMVVRRIMTGIQPYPVPFIDRMRRKWGAEIYDYYGTTQYATACTCENGPVLGDRRGYYHMLEFVAVHEVINPYTGQPARAGEIGEMVVTPLHKKASPYLRFRLADKVRYFPYSACDCGRPFDCLETGTIARYDDMMKVKGINIWPEVIDEVVFTKAECTEYQGRLYISEDGREKAGVTLEFKPGVTHEIKQRLLKLVADEIRDKTGIGFDVKETTEPIPHVVFKVRRWTDERAKGLDKT